MYVIYQWLTALQDSRSQYSITRQVATLTDSTCRPNNIIIVVLIVSWAHGAVNPHQVQSDQHDHRSSICFWCISSNIRQNPGDQSHSSDSSNMSHPIVLHPPFITSPVIVKCQQGVYISEYSSHQLRVMFVIIPLVPYAMKNVPS